MNDKVEKLKNKMTKWIVFILIIAGIMSFSGCYYDDEANLYPGGCDTTNITYSGTIAQIMSNNCNTCHNGSAEPFLIITDNYTDLKSISEDNNRLWRAVNHESDFPMPKDRPPLSDCDLSKIRIWIDNGYAQ
jgi:hypothetical protein